MKTKKTTILIADDHALMRVGLKTMLNAQPDMTVVGEVEDGKQAIRLAKQLKPDVVVMDLMMPVVDGVEATKRLVADTPSARVLILTSFGSSPDLKRVLHYGAAGIQLKEHPTKELVAAIRTVASGKSAVPPEILEQINETPLPRELTEKQISILRSVTNGLTNKEIASCHNLSEGGVKKHLKLIFAKLGVKNRTEAIGAVLKKHLLKI